MRISDNESSDSDEESDNEDGLVVAHYSSAKSSDEEDLVTVVRLPCQTVLDVILGHHFVDTVTVFSISF